MTEATPRNPMAAAHPVRSVAVVGDRIESKDLFGAVRVIQIVHGEQVYQLRVTANDKLILVK
ncbi:hemin uptake protein HemP [Azorhizobium sp. AG788]|uniref:hemin uptake protein HemP n=1 Tax=Azorhizobium sp. AG788 TaxID=2183897 RepID=UPI003139C2E4